MTRDEHAPPHVHVISPDYSVELDISEPEIVVKSLSSRKRIKNNPKFVKEAIQKVTERRESVKAFGSSTLKKENSLMIEAVQYSPISREVEVLLSDGSRHAWRVDSLEMLINIDGKVVPLPPPSREQLLDVVSYGGGAYIYWPQIEQMFELEALLEGTYCAFRHVVRNIYTMQLKGDRIQSLIDALPAAFTALRQDCEFFCSSLTAEGPND